LFVHQIAHFIRRNIPCPSDEKKECKKRKGEKIVENEEEIEIEK
jgi:hypothetical protein